MICSECNREPCLCLGMYRSADYMKRKLNWLGIDDPKALVQKFIKMGKIKPAKPTTQTQEQINADIIRLLP